MASIGFSPETNRDGFPTGLIQDTVLTPGAPGLGRIAYYDLRTQSPGSVIRIVYRLRASADDKAGYTNAIKILVHGLPDGTYHVQHPHDPAGTSTRIRVVGGRGRVDTAITAPAGPIPDPSVLFPPTGPLTNLRAVGGVLQFVPVEGGQSFAFRHLRWQASHNAPLPI